MWQLCDVCSEPATSKARSNKLPYHQNMKSFRPVYYYCDSHKRPRLHCSIL